MVTFSNMDSGIICLSTDEKPTEGIANGAKLTEIDTGKTYRFNAASKEYVEYEEGDVSAEQKAALSSAISDNGMGYIDRAYKPLVVLEEQTHTVTANTVADYANHAAIVIVEGINYIVTIDGTQYELAAGDGVLGSDYYGDAEYGDYPFSFYQGGFYLPTSGTHTISIALGAQTETFTAYGDIAEWEVADDIALAHLTVGKQYHVTWDGTTYADVATDADGTIYIGSLYFGYGDDDYGNYPFEVYSEVARFHVFASTPGTHTFYIEELVETVHTIDSKFLEPYPGWDVVIRVDTYGPLGTYEYVKGSFTDLHDKLASNTPRPVTGLLVQRGNSEDGYDTAFCAVFSEIILREDGTEIYLTAWEDGGYKSIMLDESGVHYNGG